MLSARLVNYQANGESTTLGGANDGIRRARAATPENLRELFRSSIRYMGKKYYWYWVLKG